MVVELVDAHVTLALFTLHRRMVIFLINTGEKHDSGYERSIRNEERYRGRAYPNRSTLFYIPL